MKALAVDAALRNGWNAETESIGQAPDGERWIADVLASHAGRKVAIEIQWSGQTLDEFRQRHERYRASAVEALWLSRNAAYSADPTLLVVQVSGNVADGFQASIPTGQGAQQLPVGDFLEAWFCGRVRYGLPESLQTNVVIHSGELFCWSCGAQTTIVTSVDVLVGPHCYSYTVPDLTELPELRAHVLAELPPSANIGPIEVRHSRTQGRSYLSNGCAHCGQMVGEFFEHQALGTYRTVTSFRMPVNGELRAAIEAYDGYESGWAAYKASDLGL